MIRVWLKRGEDRRIRAGHVWVFSNEIDRIEATDGSAIAPGCLAHLVSAGGDPIALGYYNKASLIAFRSLSRDPSVEIGALIESRINAAIAFRKSVYGDAPGASYRMIYSEGDLLPGLIVDRFGEYLVVQIL